VRAVLAHGLLGRRDACAVDQADQLAELGCCGNDRLAVGLLTALKLASATSVACLTAFWTDSRALLPAATALLNTATAVSEPAGAFLAALSTTAMNFFCASVAWASKVLPNSAPVPAAMSYR
jgi:hypothetical protein